jgi:hypothetical protein
MSGTEKNRISDFGFRISSPHPNSWNVFRVVRP